MLCPDCGRALNSRLVNDWRMGGYVQVYQCAYRESHGTLVPCGNRCGEEVRNPREHYSFTEGLIGSGRWSCIPKRITPETCTHPEEKRITPPQEGRAQLCGVCFIHVPKE